MGVCKIDAAWRNSMLCFTGILRKRRGYSRDVVALLGKTLNSMRDKWEN
jgi:hypothetical protein